MTIDLQAICAHQTITRDDGQKIANIITEVWDKESSITIDFGNITIASVGFIDQAFGSIAINYPKEDFKKKINFINIENYDKMLLNYILISRYYHNKNIEGET